MHLIAGLISVVDPFHRHHLWGEKVGKFAEVDPVPQPLLQLCGRGQVLLQAGFHPPERTHNKQTEFRGKTTFKKVIIHLDDI